MRGDLLVDRLEEDGELGIAGAVREPFAGRDIAGDRLVLDSEPSIFAKLDLPEPIETRDPDADAFMRLVGRLR